MATSHETDLGTVVQASPPGQWLKALAMDPGHGVGPRD